MMTHRYDPGCYSGITFTGIGRKRRIWLVANFTRGQRLAMAWQRRTGGSAIVQRTLFNTEIIRRKW